MLLPRAPRALLRLDAITVQRPGTTQDAEGSQSSPTAVFAGRGTVSAASNNDVLSAAARGTKVDKILSLELGLDVQPGDLVTTGGLTYEVVDADNRRLFRRVLMRRVT